MNILIIEDDIYLSQKIKEVFCQKTVINQVHTIHSYRQFLYDSNVDKYDMILLDIMLGDEQEKGGFDILTHIRKKHSLLPIIIMSSISEYCFLEQAFSLGAHDYIIKPFRVRELQIRVQRWFHSYVFREQYSYQQYLQYESLSYYPSNNSFYHNKKLIHLSKDNKYLLALFIIHRENLVSHSFLMDKLWGESDIKIKKNLRIKILRLKKQLHDIGIDQWIHTIRGEGYMLKKN